MGSKKIRNLVDSKSKKVNKSNVSWFHIKSCTLELLPRLEEIEETNDIRKIKNTQKLVQMFGTVIKYMNERLQNEIDNLEYLKVHNREKQKRLSEKQLRALYEKHAINKYKLLQLQSLIESLERKFQKSKDTEKEVINNEIEKAKEFYKLLTF